ncbi:hypothetical protein ACF3DV_29235 [Chlorogloeopsis fritschii PCC 9212]|jgi:hypothetical protein|uniref:hypothetical protein n=1 Tax=Chlorogloeopsis fritschii TaxID=1124 RepID=UPI0002E759DD|nr:hypothetical protein [Chlorogloeopsis fritschii]
MNKIQLALVVSYLVTTGYFFLTYLRFSLRHPASCPAENFLSFVMFVVTTTLWPLLIPISLVQTFKLKEFKFSTVVPVLVAISAFSFVFHMA